MAVTVETADPLSLWERVGVRAGGSSSLSKDLAETVADIQRSVVLVRSRHGTGSGVVWNSDGTIVTNHHVVHEPTAEVLLPNGDRFAARVTGQSARLDLAILSPEGADDYEWPVASVRDSAELRAGELMLAVGNPMGERNVATLGMLVAAPTPPAGPLRAAITLRPGNSGGAMADARGHIVGIPHLVMGGGLAQAVSSRAVRHFLHRKSQPRPTLGLMGHWVEVPERMRAQHGLTADGGLLVTEVADSSLAERAGIILGDLVLGFSASKDPMAIVDIRDVIDDGSSPRKLATIRAGQLRWAEVDSTA